MLQKQKEEQLRIDEELAKSLLENDQDPVVVVRIFKQNSSNTAHLIFLIQIFVFILN